MAKWVIQDRGLACAAGISRCFPGPAPYHAFAAARAWAAAPASNWGLKLHLLLWRDTLEGSIPSVVVQGPPLPDVPSIVALEASCWRVCRRASYTVTHLRL